MADKSTPVRGRTARKTSNKGGGAAQAAGVGPSTVQATATAKYVQSFDERPIMQEQPPTIPGGPRGNPRRDDLPEESFNAARLRVYSEAENYRADGSVLVRETPSSKKSEKNAWPNKLRIYRPDGV